jgi:WD40 repeat protein
VLQARAAVRPGQVEAASFRRGRWVTSLAALATLPLLVLATWLFVGGRRVLHVTFAPNGRTLIVNDATLDGTWRVRLLDAATGRVRATLPGSTAPPLDGPLEQLALAPDGRTVAFAARERGKAGCKNACCEWVITLWDQAKGKARKTLPGHGAPVVGLAFASAGRVLLSADRDGQVDVRNSATGRLTQRLSVGGPCACVAFTPDGRRLAAGLANGQVTLVDVATGRTLARLAASASPPASLAFAPNGKTLAVAGLFDSHVTLWQPDKKRSWKLPAAPVSWQTCVAFSPDGRLVAVAGGSFRGPGRVTVFRATTLEELHAFAVPTNTATALAFAPDGSTLAAGGGRPLSLLAEHRHGAAHRWDLRTGRPLPAED